MSRPLRSEMGCIHTWQERAARVEKEVLDKARRRQRVSNNVEALFRERLTFGDRLSDRIADVAGS